MSSSEEQLKRQICELQRTNAELLKRNGQLEAEKKQLMEKRSEFSITESILPWECPHDLTKEQVARYSRQLVLPSFGPEAQASLLKSKVLVIGAGGLGSAALLYLAGAGIGHLGIIDRDEVALNNLHRQVLHKEASVGLKKTESARQSCQELNGSIKITINSDGLKPVNAIQVVSGFHVVIDASDNIPTRYLANDVCKVLGIPLVSGAAIGTDGQLTVYNYGVDGLCYRCLFPTPPPVGACSSCSESGVLGPVPGVIGTLQALEAIKIITRVRYNYTQVGCVLNKRLLVFDFLSMETRCIRLRNKRQDCVCCGDEPIIIASNLAQYDYFTFTGQPFYEQSCLRPANELSLKNRISPKDLVHLIKTNRESVFLMDVRPVNEFQICHFQGAYF
eukprot:g6559.t1